MPFPFVETAFASGEVLLLDTDSLLDLHKPSESGHITLLSIGGILALQTRRRKKETICISVRAIPTMESTRRRSQIHTSPVQACLFLRTGLLSPERTTSWTRMLTVTVTTCRFDRPLQSPRYPDKQKRKQRVLLQVSRILRPVAERRASPSEAFDKAVCYAYVGRISSLAPPLTLGKSAANAPKTR